MAKSSVPARGKFSMQKSKKGLLSTLYVMAGLFAGGLLEQYAMSKITFFADTKAGATPTDPTTPNTVGILLKSAIYIVGGLIPAQITNNEALAYAGYGISAYGGLKAIKSISDKGKVYGLGSLVPHQDVQLPQYAQYNVGPQVSLSSM